MTSVSLPPSASISIYFFISSDSTLAQATRPLTCRLHGLARVLCPCSARVLPHGRTARCVLLTTHKCHVIPSAVPPASQRKEPNPPRGLLALHNLSTTASLGIFQFFMVSPATGPLHTQFPDWNTLLSPPCPVGSQLWAGPHFLREGRSDTGPSPPTPKGPCCTLGCRVIILRPA